MKIVKYLAIVLAGFFLFEACQKETSFERGSIATGILTDSFGNCLPATPNGNYSADSTLTDNNYVVIQVNFSTPGIYNISTDTSNGFSFQSTGSVKDTGLQNIKLTGTGKPTLAQLTNFVVTFDGSICMFSIPVTGDSTGGETAVYTLAGSPNACSNVNILGTYQEGIFLTIANEVSIEVNVTTTGTYVISTTPTNGMTFSSYGTFTETGVQPVTLQGLGTPNTAGTTTVPINAGGTSCSFTITVNSSQLAGADTAWQFNVGTNFYHGYIDTAKIQNVEDLGTALRFYGFSSPGTDTAFQLDILLPGSTIQTGTYNTDSANADFYLYKGSDTTLVYYQADNLVTPPVNIQVEVKSYDPVTKIIAVTFSGTAINTAGQIITVSGGKIYAKVD
ncbi:MAG: hypothetical protein WKG06_47855 [Segetibacter sp.]